MQRMRTIADAFQELKQNDPETAMTLSGLRRLVSVGKIPSLRIGRRILINYDKMVEYLDHPYEELPQGSQGQYGQIRKII